MMFWLSAYDSDNAEHSGYLLPQSSMFVYYPHRKHVASKVDKICGKSVYGLLATYVQDDIRTSACSEGLLCLISCTCHVLRSLTYLNGEE